ncbi:MAG: thioredoxin domain-containing protein [Candidatus Dormibacteria bacterium]|jgi:thioredoxin 1
MIDTVTDASFATEVVASTTPVLVELGASWCPPCRAMAPVLSEIAREREGSLRVVTVDSDANPTIVERFGVMSLPTILLFSGGEQVRRVVGHTATSKLLRIVDEALAEHTAAL